VMRRFMAAVFLLPLAVISTFLLTRGWMQKTADSVFKALPVYQEITDFTLTDQQGNSFGREALLGKVWIADFIFTRCAGPCPVMTNQMKRLQDGLRHPDLALVSFTVDPERDSPEVLANYAGRFAAGPSWHFLTGDKKTLHDLSMRHFYLGVADVPPEEREAPDQSVTHSTKFALVDRAARVRGYYDGMDPQSFKNLLRDARQLLKNG